MNSQEITSDKTIARYELMIETETFTTLFFEQILKIFDIVGPQNIEKVEFTEQNTSEYSIQFIQMIRLLSENDLLVNKLFGKDWWTQFVKEHLNPISAGLAFRPKLRLPGEPERSIFKSGMCALCFRFVTNGLTNDGICYGYCVIPD